MYRQEVDDYNQALMVKYKKSPQMQLYKCIYPLKNGETCKFVGDLEDTFEHAGEHSQCFHFYCAPCHTYFVTWRAAKAHKHQRRCWLPKGANSTNRSRDHEEFIRKTFIVPVKEEEVRTMKEGNDQDHQIPRPSTSSIETPQDPRIPSSSSTNPPRQNVPAPGLITNFDFEDCARILKKIKTGESSESASTSKSPGMDCYQKRQLQKSKAVSKGHRANTIEEGCHQEDPEPVKESDAPVSISPIPIKKPRMSESVNLPSPSLSSTPKPPAASSIALPIHDFSVPPPPLGFGCLFPTDLRLNRPPPTLRSPVPMATNPVLPISPVLPSFNLPPPMIPTPKRPAHPLPSLDLNLPAPCAVKFVNSNDPPEQLAAPTPVEDQNPENGPQPCEAPVKLPRWKPLPPAPSEPPGIIRKCPVPEESNAAEATLKKASSNISNDVAAAQNVKTEHVDAPVEKTLTMPVRRTIKDGPGKAPQPAKKKFSMKDVRSIKIEVTDTDEDIHARHFPDHLTKQQKKDLARQAEIVDPQANGGPSDKMPPVPQAPDEEMTQLQAQDVQDGDLQNSLENEGSSNLGHENSISEDTVEDAHAADYPVSMENEAASQVREEAPAPESYDYFQQDQQAPTPEPQVFMEDQDTPVVGFELEVSSSSTEEDPATELPQEASHLQPVPAEQDPAVPPTRSIKPELVEASASRPTPNEKEPALPLNRSIKQEPVDEDAQQDKQATKSQAAMKQEGSSNQVPEAAPTLQPPPVEKNPEMPRTINIKQEPADDYEDSSVFPEASKAPMCNSQMDSNDRSHEAEDQHAQAAKPQVPMKQEGPSNEVPQAASNIPPIPATRSIKPEPADDYEDVPAADSSEPGPSEPYRRPSQFDIPPSSSYGYSSTPDSSGLQVHPFAPLPTPLQHHQDFFNDASGVFYQHPSWHQPSSSQDSAPDLSHQSDPTSPRRYEKHVPDVQQAASDVQPSTSPRHYEESQLTSSSSYDHDSAPDTSQRRYGERDSSEEPELRIDEQACDQAWNLPTSSSSPVAPRQIKSGTRKIAPSKPPVQSSPEAPVAHLEDSVVPKTPRQIKSGTRKIAPSMIQVPTISAVPEAAPEAAADVPTPAMPSPEVAEEVAVPKRRPRKKQKKITMPRKAARRPAPSTSGSKRGRKKKVVVDSENSDDLEPLPRADNNVITYKKLTIKMMKPLTAEEEIRLSQPSTPAATPSQGGSELPAELVGLLVPRRAAAGAKRYREPSEERPAIKRKSLETDSTISSSFSTPRASADSEVKNMETSTAEKWSKKEEDGQDEPF
ncbi:hypothetical protein L5515_005122 [Caenorhabditis briggsae]|uniref:Uncharacterized protein n=1 Tax=Caenorhabditis briggsae TaxID=6238 RepID=A0AAE9ERT6_CAEBR|nr:hypothetical protein L5515_005122 [Caenorhabditis briggsae]